MLLFSKGHFDGLPKTSPGIRRNLYFNYVHAHYNVVMPNRPTPTAAFHRQCARFDQTQRALTHWMEFTHPCGWRICLCVIGSKKACAHGASLFLALYRPAGGRRRPRSRLRINAEELWRVYR